jgi:hypothetical protein
MGRKIYLKKIRLGNDSCAVEPEESPCYFYYNNCLSYDEQELNCNNKRYIQITEEEYNNTKGNKYKLSKK